MTRMDAMPVVRMVPWRYPLESPRWDGTNLQVRVPRGRFLAPSILREGLYGVQIEIPAPPVMADQALLVWYSWIPVATISCAGSPFIEMELQFYANRLDLMDPCPACGYMLAEERLTPFQGSILSCSKSGHLFPKVTM